MSRSGPDLCAVLLAGGRGTRLGGVEKATLEVGGRTLLDRGLDALRDAAPVVVVGDPVATARPVRFCREEPAYGGPVAALLAGVDALAGERLPAYVAVLAVDMPAVTDATVTRLRAAAEGHDGARLVDDTGRGHLALVLATAALDGIRPPDGDQHGMALHRLLAPLDLVDVRAVEGEHHDVDTWADLPPH
ncbi:NTP transferase domain-containing protein [Nocardioides sp. dk4132]|nr:NTP transferase domain-containing protein [Nocardioides sp. dk4132]QGA09481.1 NTP transferase domain-containing protein [Nocardioides sp. dk884]